MRILVLLVVTACHRNAPPTCDLEQVPNDLSVLDGGGTFVASGVDTAVADPPGLFNMGEGHEHHDVRLGPYSLAYEQDTYKGQNRTSQATYVLHDDRSDGGCAGELTIADLPNCPLTLRQNGTVFSVLCTEGPSERVDLSFRRKPR